MLRIGDVVASKYLIESLVGEGAMGAVFAATHVDLGKRVAVKVLKPEIYNAAVTERFVAEAKHVASLRNEHVCQVLDFGRLPGSETPYIVMELLEGEPLDAVFERGPLRVGELARYMLETCEALEEAHQRGIVHRDLKPGNIFRVRKPNGTTHIKLLDFGVSKFQHKQSVFETAAFSMIGTPAYMSPEQVQSSRDVDARSDIWALGVVMYQGLTGHLPFAQTELLALATSIVSDQPEPPSRWRPEVTADIERVVMRCLAKHPDARFQSIGDVAAAITPLADTVVRWTTSASAPTVIASAAPITTTLGSAASERSQTLPPQRRPRWPVALAFVGAAAGASVFALKSRAMSGGRSVSVEAAPPAAKLLPPDAAIVVDAMQLAVVDAAVADSPTATAAVPVSAPVAKEAPPRARTSHVAKVPPHTSPPPEPRASTPAPPAPVAAPPPEPPRQPTKVAEPPCAADDTLCLFRRKKAQ